MVRPSLLVIAKDCGHAVKLSEQYPEGSSAASAGTKWHAEMAEFIATREGRADLAAAFATMPKHEKAEPEVRAVLKDPETGEVISEGTADIVLTHEDGSITVVDWKTGSADKVDPPDTNLQVLCYALAVAMERGAKKFRAGLYFTNYPPLRLSRWFTDGDDFWRVLDEIKTAASNDRDTPVKGPHCDRCYRRTHCSAWMLPASLGETALAPFTAPAGLNKSNAAEALRVVKAMKDAIEIADKKLKDFARETGGIESDGKVWAPTERRGRRSISVEKVESAGLLPTLEEAGCVSDGGTYEVFAWSNASSRKTKRSAPSDWLDKKVSK
jgi:hypothetical protein